MIKEKVTTVEHAAPNQPKSLWLSLFIVFIGLTCLAEGAGLTVSTAKVIGNHAGLSNTVIGATIIAVGTSLPELITCLIAAFKGHDDLSVGNLVGSNIFNTLLVVGASGLVRPYSIESKLIGWDYWLMILVFVIFSMIAFTTQKISKTTGFFLFMCYVGYIAYNFDLFQKASSLMSR